ncbi:MAG: alpha/beta hydrolase [Bacteroidales bacterium]|nr:MAG: alpha/beta hydrolase [Bacteroidales bacterium]
MKSIILSLAFCLLIFFFYGCKSEHENSAVSSDNVKIVFNQQGKAKPAVIFIHGWTNPKDIWDDQVAHFSEKYRAIAVDLAGSGESGNNRSEWTMEAFGNDVAAVINKLKLEEVVLVGFSMGTTVAIQAANQLPEKVIGVVLVDDLTDPNIQYPPEVAAFLDSLMMDLVTDMTNEKLVAMGFYKKNHEATFQRLSELYPDTVSQIGWNESLQGYIKWINEELIKSVKQLKVPVTAINSDLEPTNVEAWIEYVPSFQAKIMTDVGHLVFWDNPGEFNRLLEETIQEFIESSKSE